VELFAGSGSMGIEAISRGAKSAIFVEKDRDSFKCLKENLSSLKIDDFHAINGDTFQVYDSVISDIVNSNSAAFLYFDPPFDIRDGMENIYNQTVSLIEKTPSKSVQKIFLEHISSFDSPDTIANYTKVKIRKFGKTTISEYAPI
jgi:16S rRNA (guanine(966)-N(2))-methyltransferase RsmD